MYQLKWWIVFLLAVLAIGACTGPESGGPPALLFVATRADHAGEEIYALDILTGEERRLTFSGEGGG